MAAAADDFHDHTTDALGGLGVIFFRGAGFLAHGRGLSHIISFKSKNTMAQTVEAHSISPRPTWRLSTSSGNIWQSTFTLVKKQTYNNGMGTGVTKIIIAGRDAV